MLSTIPAPRETEKVVQASFGGIDKRPGARSGIDSKGRLQLVIKSERNIGWQKTPLLATRRVRRLL